MIPQLVVVMIIYNNQIVTYKGKSCGFKFNKNESKIEVSTLDKVIDNKQNQEDGSIENLKEELNEGKDILNSKEMAALDEAFRKALGTYDLKKDFEEWRIKNSGDDNKT